MDQKSSGMPAQTAADSTLYDDLDMATLGES